MQLVGEHNEALDAQFDIEPASFGVEIVLHSRQGSPNTRVHRNVDYFTALEAILRGLAKLDARITSISIDSAVALRLPAADRRVPLDYPIRVASEPDCAVLRRRITEGQRKVAWTGAGITHRGNNHKRIRIVVDLVTVPTDMQTLLRTLRVVEPVQANGSQSYRPATPNPSVRPGDLFTFDPAARERALIAHARTQNALAEHVRSLDLTPLSPGRNDPDFDLAWWAASTMYVAEVKSLSGANATQQLRLGLGQVLQYRCQLARVAAAVVGVLAVEREPQSIWFSVCVDAGVLLTWPPHWPGVDATLASP